MKESMGNAFVFGLVLAFAFLMMVILTAAINYSRANKVKNKILHYVSAYAEYNTKVDANGNPEPIDLNGSDLEEQINRELSEIGYKANYGGWSQNDCDDKGVSEKGGITLNSHSNYHYCVYAFPSERGYYYGVKTFMYFDVPVIGAQLELPVYGETRIIYDLGEK